MAFSLSSQHILNSPNLTDQFLEFCKLALRQFLPANRRSSACAEAKKELPNFIQCEANLPRSLEDCQSVKRGFVVASLAADSEGRIKEANLFVVADGGGPETNSPGDFRNG